MERILLVESDPENCDLVAHQTLEPLGYQVAVIEDSGEAIQEVVRFDPDMVLMNLNLTGLSGKDLLVAFSSQGINIPVVILAEKGQEADVIQAFRLGAFDYISSPVREAELVSAVERVLTRVRERKEKERLSRQLGEINSKLEQRVKELTTISALGKAVTSITNQQTLFDRILEGAMYITEADRGWVLLRKDNSNTYYLRASRHLPATVKAEINQPWNDGISSLVALSGESLLVNGAPLKRMKIARFAKSVLVVPVKVHDEVIGLLVVTRDKNKPFSAGNQTMLEAIADYAAISLVNSRLFAALEARAKNLQENVKLARESEESKTTFLYALNRELQTELKEINDYLDALDKQIEEGSERGSETLAKIKTRIQLAANVVELICEHRATGMMQSREKVDYVPLLLKVISEKKEAADANRIKIEYDIQDTSFLVSIDPGKIKQVLDVLLTKAIETAASGIVFVRLTKEENRKATTAIQFSGDDSSREELKKMFDPVYQIRKSRLDPHEKITADLALANEVIKTYGSEIHVENDTGHGTLFVFSIPLESSLH